MRKFLLLQVGHTFEHLVPERGDYDRWFGEALGLGDALEVVRPVDGDPLPAHCEYGGVVVTGSWAMVTERAPWSVASAAYLRELVAREAPVLGVCYGHQLLVDALGGEVAYNPRGRSAGTVELTLTEAARDCPLFSVLSERPRVQVSHMQSALRLPEGAVRLAASPLDPNHAFRYGERTWGVQFHPEFDAWVSREYILARREAIEAEGLSVERLLANVRDSDDGARLLKRFVELVDER